MSTEKKVRFKVGRPIQHENVQYGIGEYDLSPGVAEALKRKNAGAPVETHLAAARARGVAGDVGSTAEFGDKPDLAVTRTDPNPENPLSQPLSASAPDSGGVNPGGAPDSGGAGTGGAGTSGAGVNPSNVSSTAVEQLTGELPNDFPEFEKLVGSGVLRYEQLTTLKSNQLEALGIDEAGVQAMTTRLYEEAQKAGAGDVGSKS